MTAREWVQAICFSLVTALIVFSPALLQGAPQSAHDVTLHHMWYKQFVYCLGEGTLYPRWLHQLNEGLGSPVMFFYGPLSYYSTAILQWMFSGSLESRSSFPALTWGACLAAALSGVSFYYWMRTRLGHRAALIGALLYIVAPYHTIDYYHRFAIAELWAFAYLPVLLAALGADSRKCSRIPSIGMLWSLLALTHPPTFLMITILVIGYALFESIATTSLHYFLIVTGSICWGLGIAALYWVPAFGLKQFVSMNVMTSGHFYYKNSLFFRSLFHPARDNFETLLLAAAVMVTGSTILAYVLLRHTKAYERGLVRLALFLGGFSLVMMTPLSIPLWEVAYPLQSVQFPWRFSLPLTVASSAIFAVAADAIIKRESRARLSLLLGGAIVFLCSFYVIVSEVGARARTASPGWIPQRRWDSPEYRTIWNREVDLEALIRNFDEKQFYIQEGQPKVQIDIWKSREIGCRVESEHGAVLLFRQFYFPNWKLKNSTINGVLIDSDEESGLLRLRVPPGRYTLQLNLGNSAYETAGTCISSIVLFSTIVVRLLTGRLRERKREHLKCA